jgi:sterol desaturase/sphingolipid hydroxylase (fatty acid hydroxylase superfamily)
MLDLTVAAVPFYFGSMGAEYRALVKRADFEGPSRADYTRDDTVASLAMGVGSLVAPFAAAALARQVLPGKGRFPKVLVRTAAVAAIATTIADRVSQWDRERSDPRRRRVARLARKVARIGGPVAVATGGLALSTTVADRTRPDRMWAGNHGRDLGEGLIGWMAALAGWDFIYYWNHRFMHEVRALWAIHVVHHSSERYNLSTALRQPVADVFGVFVPYGFLAWFGVRPRLIAHARGVNLLYQYWIHTDTLRRMGAAEELLNTPSHHRVHHGRNPHYIDRNHGGTLIVWDRLFGTFAAEEDEPVYGITTPLQSWNPLWAHVHYWVELARKARKTGRWRDRFRLFWKPPGWHPEDLGGPVAAPEVDRATLVKYDPPAPRGLRLYVLSQFVLVNAATTAFLFGSARMSGGEQAGAATLVVLSLASLGGLLDRRPWAFRLEVVRVLVLAGVTPLFAAPGVSVAAAAAGLGSLGWLLRYRHHCDLVPSRPRAA